MAQIDAFFKLMNDQGASDLHLVTGQQPVLRIQGELTRVKYRDLDNDGLIDLVTVIPNYFYGGGVTVFMNLKREEQPDTSWGAASQVGAEAKTTSDLLNYLLMLAMPLAVMGFLKIRRNWV